MRELKDRLFTALVIALALLAIAPLLHMIYTIFVNGLQVLAKAGPRFFIETPPPPVSKEVGGIAPALYGSLLIVGLSLPITVAISLPTAIMTTELPGNPVSKVCDVLARSFASLPTVLVSMVVYIVLVVPMGRASALAGAVALSLVSIPYAYTAFSSALRSVPDTYREAAYSIGMTRWGAILKVSIPVARRVIAVGVLLTFARAMGETAALLFTIGSFRTGINIDPLRPADAVPLLIFEYIITPFRVYHEMAWGAALVLLLIYLIVFLTVKYFVKEVKL